MISAVKSGAQSSVQSIGTLNDSPSEWQATDPRDYIADEILSSTACIQVCTSPLDVWVQLDLPALKLLEEQILDLGKDAVPLTSAKPGDKCLVSYGPGYCRAVVESIKLCGCLGIRHTDYGNFYTVFVDELRTLPDSLIYLPPLAIKCALDDSHWNSTTLERLHRSLYNKLLTVKVVKKTAEHLFVRLIDADINKLLRLPASITEEVHVSFVDISNRFWIQKNLQAIEEIQKTLQSVKSAPPVTEPNIGQNYAVLHPLYQQWYRARLEQSEGLVDCHSVTFMDYGDVQKVPLSALRLLPPMIRCIPPMSSLCSFRQPLSPLPLDPEIEERLRNELRKCTEGILCRVVMFPVKKGSDRFLVDSLFAGSTDVIDNLKSSCNSTMAIIRYWDS